MPAAGNISVDDVKKMINSCLIVVFSKTYCPYCDRAKRLIESLGFDFEVYELDEMDDGGAIQSVLASISGCRTVPQIFVGGEFVGGCDTIHSLHSQGKFVSLIQDKQKTRILA